MRTLNRILSLASLACLALVTACSTPVEPAYYINEKPALDLTRYFSGTLDANGMFQDRAGTVIKRFSVVMNCHWEGDVGTLDEDFTYADGVRQRRVWTLRKVAADRFIGTAADVIGGAEGVVSGNALRWRYTLALPVSGKVIDVHMEDWMYLMSDQVMLNRAVMSKFGVRVGEVTLSFARRP